MIHAFTVEGVFRASLTSVYSFSNFGRRSGTAMWMVDFSERIWLHHGIALKCEIGSGVGWPWLEGVAGFDMVHVFLDVV